MCKKLLKASIILSVAILPGCASAPERPNMPVAGTFERADTDGDYSLDYNEYRNFSNYEAQGDATDRAIRKQEEASGNLMLHKRFLMLDQNNDGKLSYVELGGGS